MNHTSMPLQLSQFRCRFVTYVMIVAFAATWLPAAAYAQQFTGTLVAPTGTVLVNGLIAEPDARLIAGDVIETGDNAGVVLELSDGSQIEIGANTQLNLAQLAQTGGGAKVSKIKLAWGWMRARLSPGYQNPGSRFDVETPNALVGVKFSQPDVEVSYWPDAQETQAIAHTVALLVKNLLTGEEMLVPVGSSVIITLTAIQIGAGLVEAGAATAHMGAGAKVVLGAVAAAGIGGGIVLATGGKEEDGKENGADQNFTGRFESSENWDGGGWIKTIELTQSDHSIHGQVRIDEFGDDCQIHGTATLSGEVLSPTQARAYPSPATLPATCPDGNYAYELPNPFELSLEDDGNGLYVSDPWGVYLERQ